MSWEIELKTIFFPPWYIFTPKAPLERALRTDSHYTIVARTPKLSCLGIGTSVSQS